MSLWDLFIAAIGTAAIYGLVIIASTLDQKELLEKMNKTYNVEVVECTRNSKTKQFNVIVPQNLNHFDQWYFYEKTCDLYKTLPVWE